MLGIYIADQNNHLYVICLNIIMPQAGIEHAILIIAKSNTPHCFDMALPYLWIVTLILSKKVIFLQFEFERGLNERIEI